MKQQIIKISIACLAVLALSAPSTANNGVFALDVPTIRHSVAEASDFDSQWAVVDQFIADHALAPNDTVRLQLKSETRLGIATWSCSGPQLGWPTDPNALSSASTLTFDSSLSALTCAGLILAILPNSGSGIQG